jgi:metal-sulfur cluster biosynthetic enzyme
LDAVKIIIMPPCNDEELWFEIVKLGAVKDVNNSSEVKTPALREEKVDLP